MDLEKEPLDKILGGEKGDCKVELIVKQDGQNIEETISLQQLWGNLMRGKSLVALIAVGSLLVSIVVGGVYLFVGTDYKGTASTIVSFNYDGIDEGLDPHGKTFDIGELKNSEILHKTVEDLSLSDIEITADDIKRNISISGIMPDDIMESVLLINRMAEKDVSNLEKLNELEYHPIEYKIDFKIPKDLNISGEKAEEILDAVISNYRDYFIEKYSDKKVLSTAVSAVDFNKYDYPEFVMLVNGQLKTIENYVELKSNDAPDFRSDSTQMTFGDLLAQFQILETVDLNRIQALINSFNLTKDARKLEAIYQNYITQMDVKVKQKEEESISTRQQADAYKKDTNLMVMSGATGSEPLEMTQSSKTYDNLVEQSTRAANEAIRMKYEIEYYKELIANLKAYQTDPIEGEVIEVLSDTERDAYIKDVETQIEDLSNNMNNLVNLTNQAVDDYFEAEAFKDAVKVNVASNFASGFRETFKTSIIIVFGITFVGFILGLFIVLLKSSLSSELVVKQNDVQMEKK